jgi:hypothetical protein
MWNARICGDLKSDKRIFVALLRISIVSHLSAQTDLTKCEYETAKRARGGRRIGGFPPSWSAEGFRGAKQHHAGNQSNTRAEMPGPIQTAQSSGFTEFQRHSLKNNPRKACPIIARACLPGLQAESPFAPPK